MTNDSTFRGNIHPDAQLLDMLRAGLLDDDPQAAESVKAHLRQCGACRRRAAVWEELNHATESCEQADPPIGRELAARRRAVLAGTPGGTRRRRFAGMALAATLAVMALGIGVVYNHQISDLGTQHAAMGGSVPDLYADIDFYIWLAEHKKQAGDRDGGNT